MGAVSKFDPIVLRETSKRMRERVTRWEAARHYSIAVDFDHRDASQIEWAAEMADLLADLLDAIDTMRGRLPHPTNMTAFARGRLSAMDELSALLEAHRG